MPRKTLVPKLPPAAETEKRGSVATTSAVVDIKVSDIAAWPQNPRRFSDDRKFRELVAMVEAQGVLQNIVLRPHPSGPELYQIVCGERRWRAALRVGLGTIPAAVRVLTDKEAFELAVIENVGREDMSPVDEASAYQKMMLTFEYSAEDVAAKLGKPVGYIHQRIVLCRLVEEAKEWVRSDRMTVGGAIELARVNPDLQRRFLKDMEDDGENWSSLNAPAVRGRLRADYLRRLSLSNAPFDTRSTDLVDGAGACGACPKNTACQRSLFTDDDSKDGDTCLDEACWDQKVAAHWQRIRSEALKAGCKVLEGKEAESFFSQYGGLSHKSGLTQLSAECRDDTSPPGSEDEDADPPECRTYGELLQEVLKRSPEEQVLIKHPTRPEVYRCVRDERLPELLRQAGHEPIATEKDRAREGVDQWKRDSARRDAERRADAAARADAIGMLGTYVHDRLGAAGSPLVNEHALWEILLLLVSLLLDENRHSDSFARAALTRRGLAMDPPDCGGPTDDRSADSRLRTLGTAELLPLFIEVVLEEKCLWRTPALAQAAFAKVPGLDYAALVSAHMDALTTKARAASGRSSNISKSASSGKNG